MTSEDDDAFDPVSIPQIATTVYDILSAKRALTSESIFKTALVLVDVVVGPLRVDLSHEIGVIRFTRLTKGKDLAVC